MRKFIAATLASLTVFSLLVFTVPAAAADLPASAPASVASVPNPINRLIAEILVAQANLEVKIAVQYAILTPKNDVPELLAYIDGVAQRLFRQTAALGVTVVCEYEYIEIDGQIVAIDPFKVAG